MKRLISLPMREDIIEATADFIVTNFSSKVKNFDRIACVFSGKRPAVFLRRAIARKVKGSFIPPEIFSIDEFIDTCRKDETKNIPALDAPYLLYTLVKEHFPQLLDGRQTYAEFLPTANEILSFIDQLDLEDIHDSALVNVEHSAHIGYDVPASINTLLRHIVKLRRIYHDALTARASLSHGLRYLHAAKNIASIDFKDFDVILFCGFFYLNKCEEKVMKDLYTREKAVLIFQGDGRDWPVLARAAKVFGSPVETNEKFNIEADIRIYQGFDMHSQVGAACSAAKDIPDKNKALIVLPRPETLIPLVSQVRPYLGEFNISMGYPLKRSSLYVLFELLYKAQESRRGEEYYTRDYLNLIRHPLVKNITIIGEPAVTRILAHKIEDFLTLEDKPPLAGRLFISLKDIENNDELFADAHAAILAAGHEIDAVDLRAVVKELHYIFLAHWDEVRTFNDFAHALERILDILVQKSIVWKFPFNIKVAQKLYDIHDDFEGALFAHEDFSILEIWRIFRQHLDNTLISFTGSPLKGAQILGLMEARSLVFDDVIILDANEGLLPKIKIYEPLIPREVMLSLGLSRLADEEQIQRYQFMRLLAAAKRVHLVYDASGVKEKSRFIEDILWSRQKVSRSLEVLDSVSVNFNLQLKPRNIVIEKSPQMVEFLRRQTYSCSRIDRYLKCPLDFYYRYCLGLQESKSLLGELESRHIGTFVHNFLEEAFSPFLGKPLSIDGAYRRYYRKLLDERFEALLAPRIASEAFLLKKIIDVRMENFLNAQAARPIKRILSLEQKQKAVISLDGNTFDFQYTADRVDELIDGTIEIIDYKTGSSAHAPKPLKDLQEMEFTRVGIRDAINSFQLPVYYHFVKELYPDREVNASLYSLRSGESSPFVRAGERADIDEITHICRGALGFIFNELFDVNVPFTPDPGRNCDYCPFKSMCV